MTPHADDEPPDGTSPSGVLSAAATTPPSPSPSPHHIPSYSNLSTTAPTTHTTHTTTTTATAAPSYHPSTGPGPTPSYTRRVRPTEHTLTSNVPHFRPTSLLHKIGKLFTVTFAGQEAGADVPSYGRGALVDGVVSLTEEGAQGVLKLSVKVSVK